MSDNSSEQEPSIEEILASIRQIISDDDEEENVDDAIDSPVREKPDDVLELTTDDLVEDEPEQNDEDDNIDISMEEPDIVAQEAKKSVQSRPEPKAEPTTRGEPQPRPVPSDILSSGTQAATINSLTKLTSKMPINSSRSFDGITLEDIVREMLHPMLREWMDDNLPPMVERIVQKELEKLARRAMDD